MLKQDLNNFDKSISLPRKLKSGFFKWVWRVIVWLLEEVGENQLLDRSGITFGISHYLSKLDRVLTSRGKLGLIVYTKSIRGGYLRYLANTVDETLDEIRLTSDGIPVALGCLIPVVRDSYNFLKNGDPQGVIIQQVILSLLTVTRCLKARSDPSTSTITTAWSGQVPVGDEKTLESFWRALGIRPFRRIPKKLKWRKFHFSSKAGPNGQAIATSIDDLKAVLEIPELLKAIEVVGGEKLSSKIHSLKEGLQAGVLSGKLPVDKKLSIRKLAYFADKEGKQRVIAIFDYFSQTSLKPLHSWLFQQLKKIPQDCTFDQGSFMLKLKGATCYHCIDLRAFTDRFPIALITKTLKGVLPDDYVDSWETIMIKFPFSYWQNDKNIYYSAGNPMGAYSSWNSASLAHHYVVFLACSNLKKSWQQLPYCLLGDDLVIGDSAVAEEYTKIITSLGVEIACEKSYTSPHFIEFAKRWVLFNKEVSPFPLSALKESSKRYYSLVNTFLNGEGKGWNFVSGIPDAIYHYYRKVLKFRAKRCSELREKSVISELVCKHISGSISASECLTALARRHGHLSSLQFISEKSAKAFLGNIAVELFSDSHPWKKRDEGGSKDPPKPLGLLAELLVIKFQLYDENNGSIDLGSRLIDSHPILGSYAQFECLYIDLLKGVRDIDTVGGGDWPYLLRSFIVPASDEVFLIRSAALVPMASSIVGRSVLDRFTLLSQYHMWNEMLATEDNPYVEGPKPLAISPIAFG